MEKFFKPVHRPSGPDEIQPRRHHHHHHLPHQQDPHSQSRYTMLEDSDRKTDESQGHLRHYFHNGPHQNTHPGHEAQQYQRSHEDEILYNHKTHVTLSRASSSSLSSSSSSSSFSSWYTDASANDPFSLRLAEQPQHSLSCSNIADVRRGFREDRGPQPAVYATIKHDSVCSELHGSTQKRGKGVISSLDRGHSRSEEGLLQVNGSDLAREKSSVPRMNYGPLYKTVSLNRSLAFSEEDIVLGVSRGPKRAVSSSLLPSKGILKNKEPFMDIRKAKSMEVLSKGRDPSGQKGKGKTQVGVEQARANFVQGKLQFSAFLDEITKQVISPSALNILGVNKNQTNGKTPAPAPAPVPAPAPSPTPGPVKPQLPPKKNRDIPVEEREKQPRPHIGQEKAARRGSGKLSDCSDPDKLISYVAKNHHSSRKDRRPSPTGGSVSGDRYGRRASHLTDGTSTSPEPSLPKHRPQRKQQPPASHGQHPQHFPQHQPHLAYPGPTSTPLPSNHGLSGHGSESSSSKSDSSRATATSHSSEQIARHHPQHVGYSKQHKDTPNDAELLQVLQEENNDLHQNLLQTVVCIESLEAELQRTRDELGHFKEKYRSLLETHTGTKQANNLLGEHLHIASESLCSERKYLLNRVYQLSSELEDAHRTMAALENINVPCLIKELMEKHFNSAEAIQKFLSTPAPISHAASSPQADGQSQAPKMEEAAHDWLAKSEARPQRVTAFIPFKQGAQTTGSEVSFSDQYESPFSVADISTAIYKKMVDSYAARPQPLYPQSQPETPLGTDRANTPPDLQQAHVGSDSWSGKGGVKVSLLEEGIVDVTSTSAQLMLDDFLQQLLTHNEAGGGTEQQGRQERVGGAEHTGKVAD